MSHRCDGCDTRLSLNEFEEVSIDLVSVRGRHAMRESGIRLQRAVFQELHRLRSATLEGTNLIVLARSFETGVANPRTR